MRIATFIITAIFLVSVTATDYERYKVYKIHPQTQWEVDQVNLFKNNNRFDFWKSTRNEEFRIDVMVPPDAQTNFEQFMRQRRIQYKVMIDNVKRIVQNERELQQTNSIEGSNRITYDKYHRHDVINNHLKDLAKNYSNIVSLELVGKSLENRDMIAIRISSGGNGSKPVVLIDGGIHAREWIAPATALYVIDQLVLNKNNSDLYKNVDWYILPVLNPDGYEFSHTTTRLWRKTRSSQNNSTTKCIGTDANRNFYFHWGSIGSSADGCSETYRGPSAFSEIETWSIATFARKYQKRIKLYISFHSYGQLLLYPWGYANSSASNGVELQTVGNSVADAIQSVNGTKYKVGYSYHTIYPNSGSSMDWVRGALDVPLAYTLELPDHGYGFLLPPDHIYGVVTETFAGVKVFGQYVSKMFGLV